MNAKSKKPLKVEVIEVDSHTGDAHLSAVADSLVTLINDTPAKTELEHDNAQLSVSVAFVRVGLESLIIASGADLPGVHSIMMGILSDYAEEYKEDYLSRKDTRILQGEDNGEDKKH